MNKEIEWQETAAKEIRESKLSNSNGTVMVSQTPQNDDEVAQTDGTALDGLAG